MFTANKDLLPGETLIFATHKHPVIFVTPVIWTLISLFFLFQHSLSLSFGPTPSFALVALVPGLIALGYWLKVGLNFLTSHFVVTDRRVVMREGFFVRHAVETRLAALAEIKVDQSLVGRILNYGTLTLNSFGGSGEVFTLISDPYDFQRAVSEQTNSSHR